MRKVSDDLHTLLLLLALAGCEAGVITTVTPPDVVKVPEVVVVTGAADEATRPTRHDEGAFTGPTALWVQDGALAVLDTDGPHARTGADAFAALPVGTPDAPETLSAVTAIAPRGAGVLLTTPSGFFHDAAGRLLRAPMSDSFAMEAVHAVDVLSIGADEVLWLTTTEVVRVAAGHRESLSITDPADTGALQLVVGESASQALVAQGASLYRVDLDAKSVTTLARGVGHVSSFAHAASGEVLLGTDDGLLSVTADGIVTRRTLAADGATAAAIVDLARAGDAVLLSTATQLLQTKGTTTVVLADVAAPKPHALARTADGDTFTLDGTSLVRLTTTVDPMAPSFEADVKPFLVAHCASCHTSGASYAPVIDFTKYAAAKTYAARTVARLQSPSAPMPPATTEVLTPAQYDVVVRWTQEGMLP